MSDGHATQSDRVLGILMDGNWTSGLTFVRLPKPIMSYTKIVSLLRKQGHTIEGKDVGNAHFYRWIKP